MLRTHTSPVQIRTLQKYPPPVRILAPGNVYRRDFFDATHSPMFAQIEGLAVDEGISFADLKATLTHFARRFCRRVEAPLAFRPSFFLFTEPSLPKSMSKSISAMGAVCAGSRSWAVAWRTPPYSRTLASTARKVHWLGIRHVGPGRIAQSRYGIPDCRVMFDSDMRFLQQFAR